MESQAVTGKYLQMIFRVGLSKQLLVLRYTGLVELHKRLMVLFIYRMIRKEQSGKSATAANKFLAEIFIYVLSCIATMKHSCCLSCSIADRTLVKMEFYSAMCNSHY